MSEKKKKSPEVISEILGNWGLDEGESVHPIFSDPASFIVEVRRYTIPYDGDMGRRITVKLELTADGFIRETEDGGGGIEIHMGPVDLRQGQDGYHYYVNDGWYDNAKSDNWADFVDHLARILKGETGEAKTKSGCNFNSASF